MRSSDNLAITMIGAAMLRGNAQLFADMLAELPAQQSLPAHCAAAFAPATTQEISLCQALHGESRMVFSLLQDVRPPHDDRGWLAGWSASRHSCWTASAPRRCLRRP